MNTTEVETSNVVTDGVPRCVAAADADNNEQSARVLDLLIFIAIHRAMILRTTLAGAVIATVIVFLLPPRYTATTRILPPQQTQSLASSLVGQLGSMGALGAVTSRELGLKNPNDVYLGILRSRTVEDAVVNRFDLMKVYRDKRMTDARRDLEDYSDIATTNRGLIEVSVTDYDKKRAAEMANAFIDELRNSTNRLAFTEAAQRRLFFEQQVQQARNDLGRAEQGLKELQQKSGLVQLEGQAKATIEAVANVRAQIAAKEVQLQAMRSFATEQNPDFVMAQQQLAGLRAQLTKLESQQNAGNGDIQVPTSKMPEVGLEYMSRYRDVKYYETVFELLAKQYEIAKLDEAKNASVIQVVDAAVEPDKPSSPRRLLIIFYATVASFFGALVWIYAARWIENARQVPEQRARLELLRAAMGKPLGTVRFGR